jgi:hypothetical protein
MSQLQHVEDSRGIDHWYGLVQDFTRLNLTYHSDRLAEIPGLEAKFRTPHDEYICGLWHNSIVRSSMWFVEPDDKSLTARQSYAQDTYQAPSWRWGSVTGIISCDLDSDNEDVVDILDIDFTLATSNPFGAVSKAYIIEHRRLISVWLDTDFGIHFKTGMSPEDFGWEDSCLALRKVLLDVHSGDPKGIVHISLFFLPLQINRTCFRPQGIVLRAVEDASTSDAFQRIGYMDPRGIETHLQGVGIELLCDTAESRVFKWI